MISSLFRISKWKWWWRRSKAPKQIPNRPLCSRLALSRRAQDTAIRQWPDRGYNSTATTLSIFQKRSDRRRRELFAAVQKFELDKKNRFKEFAPDFFDQRDG